MSGLLGGGGRKVKPQYTGLQTQTSSSAMTIPICWGENRLAGNIIWQGDFKSHKHKQSGKGGGSVTSSYTYSASFEVALCMGQINGIGQMWKDQSKPSFSSSGWSVFNGSDTQTPWGHLTTAYPAQAISYRKVAYVAAQDYDLGQTNTLGQHSFEVQGRLYNTGVGNTVVDADPAQVTEDFLTNADFGTLFPTSSLDLTTLLSSGSAGTTGDSAYQTYCRAMGFAISPVISSQETANNVIDRWFQLTNTAIVWTGYSLKFIPRGEDTITANGVTYLPPTTIQYALTDTDYIRPGNGNTEDPILMTRADPADAYNSLKLTIKNRANDYNDAPVEWQDQSLIDQFGLRPASDLAGAEICTLTMAGTVVSLLGQRNAYIRNTYKFKLSAKFCRIEPMDCLTCYDPRWGTFPVRVVSVEEDDKYQLSVTVEEFPAGVAGSPGQATQSTTNTPVNTAATAGPVNPPILFEVNSDLATFLYGDTTPRILAAVSGGNGSVADPNWGGAHVWLSTDGGATYQQQEADVTLPARQGKLVTSTLPAYGGANPDTVDTAHVDLAMSAGTLLGVTSAQAAAYDTLSYIDGEIFSYEDANLVSGYHYNLTTQLYRGLYGTAAGSHVVGTSFCRIDDAIYTIVLPKGYIGQTIYVKFQSFNIFGLGVQDLSTCTAYPFTPTGTGFGGGTGGVPTIPTGLSEVSADTQVTLSWSANPTSDNVTLYKLYRANGTSQPFSSATQIWSGNALSHTDTGLTNSTGYTYFLIATNVVGDSTHTAGVNATTTQTTTRYGFGFEKDLATGTASQPFVDFVSKVPWTITAGVPFGSIKTTGTGPTASTVFDLQVGGVSKGSLTFAIGATEATITLTPAASVPADTNVQIVMPANLNGMNGRLFGTIIGTSP